MDQEQLPKRVPPFIREASKSAYEQQFDEKLVEARQTLERVEAQRPVSRKGALASAQAVEYLAQFECQLQRLKDADDTWQGLRGDVESAWENLVRAVNKIIGRFN